MKKKEEKKNKVEEEEEEEEGCRERRRRRWKKRKNKIEEEKKKRRTKKKNKKEEEKKRKRSRSRRGVFARHEKTALTCVERPESGGKGGEGRGRGTTRPRYWINEGMGLVSQNVFINWF